MPAQTVTYPAEEVNKYNQQNNDAHDPSVNAWNQGEHELCYQNDQQKYQ